MNSNWSIWIHGLVAALIGGGASGIIAAQTVSGIDPVDFNYNQGLHNVLKLFAAVFILNGLLSAATYLAKSPLPALSTTTTTTATVQTTVKKD